MGRNLHVKKSRRVFAIGFFKLRFFVPNLFLICKNVENQRKFETAKFDFIKKFTYRVRKPWLCLGWCGGEAGRQASVWRSGTETSRSSYSSHLHWGWSSPLVWWATTTKKTKQSAHISNGEFHFHKFHFRNHNSKTVIKYSQLSIIHHHRDQTNVGG